MPLPARPSPAHAHLHDIADHALDALAQALAVEEHLPLGARSLGGAPPQDGQHGGLAWVAEEGWGKGG